MKCEVIRGSSGDKRRPLRGPCPLGASQLVGDVRMCARHAANYKRFHPEATIVPLNAGRLPPGKAFYTVAEVAAAGGVGAQTITHLLNQHKLAGVRIGQVWRIPRRAALMYLGIEVEPPKRVLRPRHRVLA